MSSSSERVFDIRYTQNYLKSGRLIEHLLDGSTIGSQDLVVEIGAGKGNITRCLAARCRRVIAVEKDETLAAQLHHTFADDPRVAVYPGDFLALPLPRGPYKVFANIPFRITTAIVTKLTRTERPPEDCYLVVQREASARFCGIPRETLYALLLKPWFEPAVIHRFRREDFDPAPRVDVVMLRLRKRGPPLIAAAEAQRFRDLVVHSFTHTNVNQTGVQVGNFTKRRAKRFWSTLGIDPRFGPTGIRFEQWIEIFRRFVEVTRPEDWRGLDGAERHLLEQQATLQKRGRTSVAVRSGCDH